MGSHCSIQCRVVVKNCEPRGPDGLQKTVKNWKAGTEQQKIAAVIKTLHVGNTVRAICQRNESTIEDTCTKHWFVLYTTMKRARTDILNTAANVFGNLKSIYHLAA